MRIRTTVSDLTPGQLEWLHKTVDLEAMVQSSGINACVEFEGADGRVIHRELDVRHYVQIIGELQFMTEFTKAILTPDVLPDRTAE